MKLLRTASTSRLIAVITVLVVVLAGAAVAVAGSGGGGPVPSPKPLPDAIHDALTAPEPSGVTARISFTNNLFPSGALTGTTGSALMSGANGRLWLNQNGGRIELQSDAGDVQVVWSQTKVTLYDASSNTAYVADLPKQTDTTTAPAGAPSLAEISTFLTDLGKHWTVSGATPTDVAGQAAYSVSVSPSHDGGLLGSAELAWDAVQGVPLEIAVYAQGSSAPALALKVDEISYGAVPDSDIAVPVPAGAKTVDLSSATGDNSGADGAPVTGLAAVQAAAPWAVVPDTLVGLPRQDVRLVGGADAKSKSVLAVYGQGLGAIVVAEQVTDTSAPAGKDTSAMSALPSVSLDGVTAHELSTELGTVLTWDRGGVSYILAGSVPTAAAEAAARALK